MPSDNSPARGRARAPRGTLTPEAIVEAAIAIIESDGLPALTTKRLAEDLGAKPMSLYTHFRDKAAITKAVADELFDRFEMPDHPGSDVEMLGAIMRAYFRLLVDHPVLLQLGVAVEGISPAEARFTEAAYGCLKRLGIDHRTTVGIVATTLRFVIGSALIYPIRMVWDEDPHHWDRISRTLAALPPGDYPAIHEMARNFPTFTQYEAFEFGLRIQLKAIAAEAAQAASSAAPQAPSDTAPQAPSDTAAQVDGR